MKFALLALEPPTNTASHATIQWLSISYLRNAKYAIINNTAAILYKVVYHVTPIAQVAMGLLKIIAQLAIILNPS